METLEPITLAKMALAFSKLAPEQAEALVHRAFEQEATLDLHTKQIMLEAVKFIRDEGEVTAPFLALANSPLSYIRDAFETLGLEPLGADDETLREELFVYFWSAPGGEENHVAALALECECWLKDRTRPTLPEIKAELDVDGGSEYGGLWGFFTELQESAREK